MCLIIVEPRTAPALPDYQIRNAFSSNPDGGGIMFTAGGKLYVDKGFWSADDMATAYREAWSRASGPIVLHFRLATSGYVDRPNCHPFLIAGGRIGIAHNGVLPDSTRMHASDTRYFVETALHGRSPQQLLSRRFRKHIERWIPGNKIVLLDGVTEEFSIMNEEDGSWHEGRWYSGESAWYERSWKRATGFKTARTQSTVVVSTASEENAEAEFWTPSDLKNHQLSDDEWQVLSEAEMLADQFGEEA
jgi:predicted glutamine amidotransferase